MTKDFSPISKLFYVGILLAVAAFMVKLSYGWSIDQTMVLTSAVTGDEYATDGAWLIQLAPQALLAIAGIAMMKRQNRLAMVLIVSALVVNGLDAYTNIIAFRELWPAYEARLTEMGRTQDFIEATRTVGYAVSFLVTWFEEGVMLCIGTALIIFTELAEEMRWNLPPFFRSFGAVTNAAGFNFTQASQMAASSQSDRSDNGNDNRRSRENRTPQRPQRVRGR